MGGFLFTPRGCSCWGGIASVALTENATEGLSGMTRRVGSDGKI